MSDAVKHISVCVCTYKRPEYLVHLLRELDKQVTCGLFTFSAVVCDNDHARSAEAIVSAVEPMVNFPVSYCVEARQNIALARNKAIEHAEGEFVAFIDDDEFPTEHWLLSLFQALHEYKVDGVLGPVRPHFDTPPPQWVLNFYTRSSYPTGFLIDWHKGRTGNVLLKKGVLGGGQELFRAEFRVSEDQDFFRRQIEKGRKFVWCHEAGVYEFVPPARWKTRFLLRRALLLGATSLVHPTFGKGEIVKSLIAIPAYTVALPFSVFWGQGRFMNFLISLFFHLGRLTALLGINAIKEPYVTE